MIAYKTFAQCPADQRPTGVNLASPWQQQIIRKSEALAYSSAGWTVVDESTDIQKVSVQSMPEANVITQNENNDKDKRIAKCFGTCNPGDTSDIFMKCPGQLNISEYGVPVSDPENERLVRGGEMWCPEAQPGDHLELAACFAPVSNTEQYVVKTYTEADENGDDKCGWYVLDHRVLIDSQSAAKLYAGFYLRFRYHAINAGSTRNVFINVNWDVKS